MSPNEDNIDDLLMRAEAGLELGFDHVRRLLAVNDREGKARLFAAARRVRESSFGNRVFLYGFVNFSTFCRNDCRFCHYRKSNRQIHRYRKTIEEVIAISLRLKEAGVHLIDLTMGEDQTYLEPRANGTADLARMVRRVKEAAGLPVMVSPGVVDGPLMAALAEAGADWYACYQETHTEDLYARLRIGQDYQARMQSKMLAGQHGLLIEEGIMTGLGESLDDVARSIQGMRMIRADQVRVMTFVPQENTPLSGIRYQGRDRELVILAVLRLVFPGLLIPASLDVDGLDGIRDRLNAGANVITSLVEPGEGLGGVANHALDIENARRTPEAVAPVLEACGLQSASAKEYAAWLAARKGKAAAGSGPRSIAA